jgi:hypothetical protein
VTTTCFIRHKDSKESPYASKVPLEQRKIAIYFDNWPFEEVFRGNPWEVLYMKNAAIAIISEMIAENTRTSHKGPKG